MHPVEKEQKLAAMEPIFPSLSRERLSSVLESEGGDIASAINVLLSEGQTDNRSGFAGSNNRISSIVYETGNPALDAARALQLAQDERLAEQLQEEEIQNSNDFTSRLANPLQSLTWSLPPMPSRDEISSGLNKAYDQIKFYSATAYRHLQTLYDSYVSEPGTLESRPMNVDYDAQVLRSAAMEESSANLRSTHSRQPYDDSGMMMKTTPGSSARLVSRRNVAPAGAQESSKDK